MSKQIIWLFILIASVLACMPDRYPPAPVEITRPKFVAFDAADISAYDVALRDPITMIFDESMDPTSFAAGFSVISKADAISGSFQSQDNKVIFTPSMDMIEGMLYIAEIKGNVKDTNGNSMSIIRKSASTGQCQRNSRSFSSGSSMKKIFLFR